MPFTANRISGPVVTWPGVAGVLGSPYGRPTGSPPPSPVLGERVVSLAAGTQRQVPLGKLAVFAGTVIVVKADGCREAYAPGHRDQQASGHAPEVNGRTGMTCLGGGR
jgi:hypothetical protein